MKLKRRILVYTFLLAIVWSYSMTVFSNYITEVPFWLQFILVNGVAYMFPALILGSSFLSDNVKKIIGLWSFLVGVDLIVPPLVIGLDGSYSPVLLGKASPDFFFSQIWSFFGFSGPLLFLMVYPVSFMILLFLSTYLMTEKELKEIVR